MQVQVQVGYGHACKKGRLSQHAVRCGWETDRGHTSSQEQALAQLDGCKDALG